jgi:hypothetical protein
MRQLVIMCIAKQKLHSEGQGGLGSSKMSISDKLPVSYGTRSCGAIYQYFSIYSFMLAVEIDLEEPPLRLSISSQ